MNLIISGPVYDSATPEAKEWLPVYIKDRFNLALEWVNMVRRWQVLPTLANNYWDLLPLNLNVVLHPEGYEHAGWTEPGDGVNVKVHVLWPYEVSSMPPTSSRHEIMKHEFAKLIVYTVYGAGKEWGPFGNGADYNYDPTVTGDIAMTALKALLEKHYHGDIKLRHISDLSRDL